MRNRILHYDVSRGRIPKVETILNHAEYLRHYGLTGIMLYIECVVENSTFPAIGCGNTPITKEYLSKLKNGLDVIDLDLIPLFQILGHQENLLALPGWEKHGEQASGSNLNFRLDQAETIGLIKKWLAELVPLFSSQYVHVGCDEVFTLGLGNSSDFIRKNGMEIVLAEYLNNIAVHLRAMGRRMMMYADMPIHYPGLRDLLDQEIILTNWNYGTLHEVYEQDNHHFSRHIDVCARHENWVVGNCMAEYVLTPFRRLEENIMTWLDLGSKSGARGVIISDWGSNENSNPFILTLLGSIYILQKINNSDFSINDFTAECCNFILGRRDQDFERVIRFLFTAQGKNKYFDDSRIADQRGPFFPVIFLHSPESNAIYRLCGAFSRDGLVAFEHDAREIVNIIDKIDHGAASNSLMFRDIKALCRRSLVVALRTLLCYDHAWDSGSIWRTESEMVPQRKMLEEYRFLSREDVKWYKSLWDEDNLTSCRDQCISLLENAIFETSKTIGFRDNSKNHFPEMCEEDADSPIN